MALARSSDACPQSPPHCPVPGRHLITLNNLRLVGRLRPRSAFEWKADLWLGLWPVVVVEYEAQFW
jgi:hypothetical protein